MNKSLQSAVVSVIGVIAVTAAFNGLYLNFVKPSLRWWLVLAGTILLGIGIAGLLTGTRRDQARDGVTDAAHGSRSARHTDSAHEHLGPRVGWAILVPFVILSVVVPSPLGSYAASRQSGSVASRPAVVASASDGLSLPPGDPVAMTLGEFSGRALFDETKSMTGRQVSLVGFVTVPEAGGPGEPGDWYITRIALSCCAADGYPIKVVVRGADAPATDTWVNVLGGWEPGNGGTEDQPLAIVSADSVVEIEQPEEPYE